MTQLQDYVIQFRNRGMLLVMSQVFGQHIEHGVGYGDLMVGRQPAEQHSASWNTGWQ